jgi:hypothetical protein
MLYILGSVTPASTCDVTIDTTGLDPDTITEYCTEMDAGMLLQGWTFDGSISNP